MLRPPRLALGVAVILALALASDAGGAASSLRLSGPRTNALGAQFSYTISGTATGGANFVVAWEELYPKDGCAGRYAAESPRMFVPSVYGLGIETYTYIDPGHPYSVTARFDAVDPGQHGVCAYLISFQTGATYAHGSAWWTNG